MPAQDRRQRAHRRRPAGFRFEPLEARALLATFSVSSLADAGPGTLRDAIAQANADPAADVITFARGVTGTITLGSALPDLSTDVDIEGPGASSLTVTRSSADGTPGFRVFTVDSGVTATIAGLTVSGGGGVAAGGGLRNAGTLTLSRAVVQGNTLGLDGTAAGQIVEGGGVYNEGTLTIAKSTIAQNQAVATVVMTKPGNVGAGGGLYNAAAGTATITQSTISGNRSATGGGIDNAGTLLLINSTISSNTARGNAGIIPIGLGGGIADTGPMSVVASTVSGNNSDSTGGVDVRPPAVPTTAPAASLVGSIIAGNVGYLDTSGDGYPDVTGPLVPFDLSGSYAPTTSNNLVGAAVNVSGLSNGVARSQVGTPTAPVDAKLGPLADNGGPTLTQALSTGSPAIDAALPINGVTVDQRGVPRVSKPDLGAFEVGRPADAQPAPSDYDGDGISDPATYTFITSAGAGHFQVQLSGGGTIDRLFGGADDRPVVGDFDGDGKADVAVYGYSPLNGYSRFAILYSATGTAATIPFGGAGDLPAVGDYDGDGITDLAVYGYSPLNGFSRFAIRPSTTPTAAYAVPFGGSADVAAVGDYDGDGKADVAVFGYSPLNGFSRFAILPSSGGTAYPVAFGGPGERPLSGDYDGDGKTDIAVYGYSSLDRYYRFAILPSSSMSAYSVALGQADALPVVADYDGDGKADPTVFYGPGIAGRQFTILQSSDGRRVMVALGTISSTPLPPPALASGAVEGGSPLTG